MSNKKLTIATFNMENLDKNSSQSVQNLWPTRVKVLQPMLERMKADVLLLQEVHSLTALNDLIDGTSYKHFNKVHTVKQNGSPYKKRNLVILSRWQIQSHAQYHHAFTDKPMWKKITAVPKETEADEVSWERPILYAQITLDGGKTLHVVNLHLKSMNPTAIKGQNEPTWYIWNSHSGWAEGFFLSALKRTGQALETRALIDDIFEKKGSGALIVVGGDFNAEIGSVPFKAIVGSVQDTQNPAIRDKVMIPCEYNVPPEQRYTLFHHGKGNMLDHLVVSQALYPYETSIYNEVLPDESLAFATDKKFPESDHAPVIGYFDAP
jgi:endonuclease/exonuclease/phosphatase family metal-dependent hydrolase